MAPAFVASKRGSLNALSSAFLPRVLAAGVLCAGAVSGQSQWLAVGNGAQPDALASPGFTYDAARQVMVLFGGDTDAGVLDRTWTWNGTSWTERFPAIRPSARTMSGMVYDQARQRVVLFGGYGNGNLNDTWEWDGTTWTQRLPANAPTPRGAVAMAYDSVRQRTVLFGGGLGGFMMPTFSDTWEWDGVDWSQRAPSQSPPSSRSGAMVFDSQRGVCVLFGGLTASYQKVGSTWEWNGVAWTQRFPGNAPSPRFAHGMAYDSVRQRTVLFGGGADAGELADTWEYDGVQWSLQAPSASPSGRAYHNLAYDPIRARIVLRGSRRAETWEYQAAAGALATYAPFGSGCAGWAGTPWLTANGNRPVLGQPFALSLYNLPPDHSTLVCFGLSNSNWSGVPLPASLAAVGAPGCTLLVSPDWLGPVFNWAGYATWTLTIPAVPALAGATFFQQAAAIDHSNALGLVFTNGGAGVVGDH